jgi:hypothetical protein
MATKHKIGDERWTAEHISYKRWCDLAREFGWGGEEDSDGMRAYCEPEEAAILTIHGSLDAAKAWAMATFERHPDDSAFGAIIIEHQILVAAHDDSGNVLRDCKPTWESETTYEVTTDGDMLECAA